MVGITYPTPAIQMETGTATMTVLVGKLLRKSNRATRLTIIDQTAEKDRLLVVLL